MPFYPNECFVCASSETLKTCGDCNMISYCSQKHQMFHWFHHEKICQAISTIRKQENVSHIFENLRDADSMKWKLERGRMSEKLASKFGLSITPIEEQMFLFSRACFVCHESRPERLKKCPDCTWASFCIDHPSSPLHSKDCFAINYCHELENKLMNSQPAIAKVITTVVNYKSSRNPSSMVDYFNQTRIKMPADLILYASDFLSVPLTIFNALQKLDQPPVSNMVVHVVGLAWPFDIPNSWEALLHLLPGINRLKVVVLGIGRNERYMVCLCKDCCSNRKLLCVEKLSVSYAQYLRNCVGQMPNIVVYVNVYPTEGDERQNKIWNSVVQIWNHLVRCPLVITTATKKEAKFINKSLKSTFWGSLVCFDGLNSFGSMKPLREWEDGGIYRENEFMIVCKAPEIGEQMENDGEFLEGISLFSEKYSISKKNILLKEENKKLEDMNSQLKQENKMLTEENELMRYIWNVEYE